jgi:GNAT superfamily N-acetyltransferase
VEFKPLPIGEDNFEMLITRAGEKYTLHMGKYPVINLLFQAQEKREELLSSKDNIFLLLVNGNVAASASVKVDDKDSLGPIFVVPSYQGKGYGRIITQFAINEAIHRGINNINLEVVEWNIRAVNLYISLGFDIIQATHTYRRFRV